MEKYLADDTFRNIIEYCNDQLIRIYPEGLRVYSSNYNPMRMWCCGVQMAALNYQTKDKPMQLNQARFAQNGGCGYVLKPDYLRSTGYNPFAKSKTICEVDERKPMIVTIRVLCAKNLRKNIKEILSPSIEVEMLGANFDCKKYSTKVICKYFGSCDDCNVIFALSR